MHSLVHGKSLVMGEYLPLIERAVPIEDVA